MKKFNEILNNGKQSKVSMSCFFVFMSVQSDDTNRTGSPTNIYYRARNFTLGMRLKTLMVDSKINHLDKAVIESGKKKSDMYNCWQKRELEM